MERPLRIVVSEHKTAILQLMVKYDQEMNRLFNEACSIDPDSGSGESERYYCLMAEYRRLNVILEDLKAIL